jgi:hypothetical protein
MMSASIRSISGDSVFMAHPHQPTSVLSGISGPKSAQSSNAGKVTEGDRRTSRPELGSTGSGVPCCPESDDLARILAAKTGFSNPGDLNHFHLGSDHIEHFADILVH